MRNQNYQLNFNNEYRLFLKAMSDQGFGSLPLSILEQFYDWIDDIFGYTPLPGDNQWEEVLNLAEEIFVGD